MPETDPAPFPELLTVAEAAKVCHVSSRTVYLWLAKKKLAHLRLSEKAIRIRQEDLKKFLDSSASGSAE